ncbi:phosphatidylethanolamine-binding protein PEBP [Cavenderia fasciculata]|uniref:Phosphatidylethanolamine-binding protein PEBP n=1 Tax=Cavenderia fasciculata TaxID=261658 RepID=F4Q7A5_CACFS|nr:phosphatidylethanolamine-binding protein PEBP [Cavenderia fasciculata]EGG16287.1 phosphatidylethanolamine-binding protein PEBP [Cavenderia fasciculata]|eukprot:XP_004354671.1 phosphatidylethanolamine-binding protein PEBP [Cavenderia fasciculata]
MKVYNSEGLIKLNLIKKMKIRFSNNFCTRPLKFIISLLVQAMSLANIFNSLKNGGVIPTLLSNTFNPIKELTVSYGSKIVQIGQVLTPTDVVKQPTVTYNASAGEHFTLILADPDAPSRLDPKYSPWLHWIITDIPENKVTEGQVMAEYIGSGPPPNTGLHRYVFILCKQPTARLNLKGEYYLPLSADKRNNYALNTFISSKGLEPVGATYFEAEFDEAVPKLYEVLGSCKEKVRLYEIPLGLINPNYHHHPSLLPLQKVKDYMGGQDEK